MGYGDVAINAVLMCKSHDKYNPCDAWVFAAQEHYPSSQSAQSKGGPKGAFLGLCSEGLVRHISKQRYARAIQSGNYAIKAVRVLQHYEDQDTELPNAVQLWDAVMRKVGKEIVHNGQMDVVLALWKAGLIIPEK
ncbi:hypothetical protein JD504_03350 [Aeromonas hydrophila]|uniref:DUF6979 family protein n=1 Tax=Aeromonas hydrophila TaxID=644 RepID=UPI00191FC499|nr:hypothetical protein [Aeromonas hydrophila]MBL0669795.1 hypothetical protein [Aeromonas hydrophila]